jgi:hypothetical protein
MDTVVSKAMIAAACDLIIDAYRMDVPAMEATDIPTIGDMINKQKWILEAKSVEKMIEVEKDILDQLVVIHYWKTCRCHSLCEIRCMRSQ